MKLIDLAKKDYSPARSEVAYRKFLETGSQDDLLATSLALLPIAWMALSRHFSRFSLDDKEDLISEAYIKIQEIVESRKLDVARGLHYYIYTSVYRKMAGVIDSQLTTNEFDLRWHCASPAVSEPHPSRVIDPKIFLEQSKNVVFADAHNAVRFSGSRGDACHYILHCLFEGRRPIPVLMKKEFGLLLPGVEFVSLYCHILLRRALYNFRDIHGLPISNQSWLEELESLDGNQNFRRADD